MPNIRKLALPMRKTLNLNSLQLAFSKWKNLQTLILGQFNSQSDTSINHLELQTIGETCRNLTTIKLFKMLCKDTATYIISYLPSLERVSFRCNYVCREAAISLIIGLPNLKILNLSHCIFTEPCRDGTNLISGMKPKEELIRIGTEKLNKFMVCCSNCPICQDFWQYSISPQRNKPKFRSYWRKLWKSDEIKELAY